MIRAQIVGATGYGGVGMVELLLRHPEIRLTSLLAVSDIGKPLSAFYPHLRGYCDQVVEEAKPERVGQDADLVIFSTPDRVGMGYADELVERGMRVLDYSGDFRFETPALYEWYAKAHPNIKGQPHVAPELFDRSVYGIPELNRARIREAQRRRQSRLLRRGDDPLAAAGHQGRADRPALDHLGRQDRHLRGRQEADRRRTISRSANESVTPYRVASHQHVYETVAALEAVAGEKVGITFVPHLVPLTRGIIVTSYAQLREEHVGGGDPGGLRGDVRRRAVRAGARRRG